MQSRRALKATPVRHTRAESADLLRRRDASGVTPPVRIFGAPYERISGEQVADAPVTGISRTVRVKREQRRERSDRSRRISLCFNGLHH